MVLDFYHASKDTSTHSRPLCGVGHSGVAARSYSNTTIKQMSMSHQMISIKMLYALLITTESRTADRPISLFFSFCCLASPWWAHRIACYPKEKCHLSLSPQKSVKLKVCLRWRVVGPLFCCHLPLLLDAGTSRWICHCFSAANQTINANPFHSNIKFFFGTIDDDDR